jgi:hypothetical protein
MAFSMICIARKPFDYSVCGEPVVMDWPDRTVPGKIGPASK